MDVSKLLAQFTRVNISTKVKYHACCRIKYQTEAKEKQIKSDAWQEQIYPLKIVQLFRTRVEKFFRNRLKH